MITELKLKGRSDFSSKLFLVSNGVFFLFKPTLWGLPFLFNRPSGLKFSKNLLDDRKFKFLNKHSTLTPRDKHIANQTK